MIGRLRTFGSVLPIALLSSGCAYEAYTPSELAPTYSAPPSDSVAINVPAREEVVSKWQLPASSPWAPYEKMTLLSVLGSSPAPTELPDVKAMDDVHRAALAATCVARAGVPNDTMWIVDLPGAASVAFGSVLSRESPTAIAPVATFNNWPAENELVPAEEALAAMIMMPPKPPLSVDVNARPLFMLDAWRLAYKDESVDEETTDNRYMLSPADFPSADTLRMNGVARVIYVVSSAENGAREEDDLNELFLAYRSEGIELAIVDLDWLTQVPEPGRPWAAELQPRLYFVEPRWTIVHDTRFYIRARGGFGGVHGVPAHGWSHYGGSGSYGGGHGYGGHGGFGGHGGG